MTDDKAWQMTDLLIDYMREGKTGLKEIPELIVCVIDNELWREFYCEPIHQVVTHKAFIDYVTDPIPSGLDTDIKTLKNLCTDHAEARDAIDRAMQRKPGDWDTHPEPEVTVDNINDNIRPTGTSKDAALRRLRKDRPDLLERVLSDELSANAAMVEAGFRKKKTPEELALHNFRKCQSRLSVFKAVVEGLEGEEKVAAKEWFEQHMAPETDQ